MALQDIQLTYVSKLAIKAGRAARKLQEKNRLILSRKKFAEIVSDADLLADEIVRTGLLKAYPATRIYSEEAHKDIAAKELLKGDWWVVDPIDGTVNFIHGFPMSAVSIAKVSAGKVVLGVVYNLFTEELFIAKKGRGAYLNGKQIWCNNHGDASRAIIACGFPYDVAGRKSLIDLTYKVLMQFQDIRRVGSAALDLSHVACGRLDGYFESVNIWDIAAARLIAEEAGVRLETKAALGFTAALSGSNLIAASPKLFPLLKKTLK